MANRLRAGFYRLANWVEGLLSAVAVGDDPAHSVVGMVLMIPLVILGAEAQFIHKRFARSYARWEAAAAHHPVRFAWAEGMVGSLATLLIALPLVLLTSR